MDTPELPESNPPEPVVGAPLSDRAERRGGLLARVLVILLTVVVTPVAAVLCGIFCCFGGLMAGGAVNAKGMAAERFVFLGFGLGALLGGGGAIYLGVRLWRHLRERVE